MRELTQARLKELLHYNPLTGVFTWLKPLRNGVRPGSVAGCVHQQGYVQIAMFGRSYRAHRLAWLYVHGTWPKAELDHINGIRGDSGISNLREATRAENGRNLSRNTRNKSGFRGVCWEPVRRRWRAAIGFEGRIISLGRFTTAKDASVAYEAKATELFGEFKRNLTT